MIKTLKIENHTPAVSGKDLCPPWKQNTRHPFKALLSLCSLIFIICETVCVCVPHEQKYATVCVCASVSECVCI